MHGLHELYVLAVNALAADSIRPVSCSIVSGYDSGFAVVALHLIAFRGCCVVAHRCDLRVGIIDYFDCGVKPIQQEIKKPRKILSGVWFTACMSPPSIGAAQTTTAD